MTEALRFESVVLRRDGRALLDGIDWRVGSDERWVVLGPNGSGKTTLLQLAGARLHPSSGTVEVLGRRLGRVDTRELRRRIAVVSDALARALRPSLTAAEIVLTGRLNVLEPWWADYVAADRAEARRLLAAASLEHLAEKAFGLCSEGERKQILLARALMAEPQLLLLDEPAAGLDLGARERLLARLASIVADESAPPVVLVTHHTEEIPAGATHAALLRGGRLVANGPLESALTDEAVSEAFGVQVRLHRDGGRWSTRAAS